MARLVLTTPEGQQVVELRPRNTLGRHPSNSVQVLDKIVSKEHCIVVLTDTGYVLQDLGSLNGTFINGERVQGERALNDGDEVSMGSTRGVFHAEVASTSARVRAPSAPPPPVSAPTRPLENRTFAVAPAAYPGGLAWGAAGKAVPTTGTQPIRTASLEAHTRSMNQTRVDVSHTNRSIGNQIDATARGFSPYEKIANNPAQLSADYERLRFSHELSREIALERDLNSLLNKILISVFRFIRADRGVIFLKDPGGQLEISASLRRDGSSDAITVSSTILDHVMNERATVLTHDAAMDFAGSKGKSMILNRISSAIVAPLLHNDDILGVLWLDSETLAQFQAKDLEMVTSIAAQAAMFIEINILGRKVEQEIVARERFSRLLSPNVAEKVLSGEMIVKQGGQLVQNCTVFNSDIRGFTRMSEGADPEAIVEMLNEYFELMVESIFKFEGTLDKFMGDGIMALWGAPVVHPDDGYRAVCCSIEQMQLLAEFNTKRKGSSLPPLGIGVGVHTGEVVAGYIGSSRALSYTVIGDTANVSARLCGIAAAGQILVSEQTLAQLNGRFTSRELSPATLRGKERPFRIFEITQTAVSVPVAVALDTTATPGRLTSD
jgi:adenylate cyclase